MTRPLPVVSYRAAPLRGRGVTGYAIGSVTSSVFLTLPGLLLLPYLTDVLGVPPAAAGVVLLVPSIWITLITPAVGRISDRATGALAQRRTWVLWAGCALAVAFPLTFATPFRPGGALQAGTVVGLLFLSSTLYACFQSPYVAIAAEITDDERARTRLMASRVVVNALTILVVGAAAPAVHAAVAGAEGYRLIALGAAVLMLAATLWSVLTTPRPAPGRALAPWPPGQHGLRAALRVRAFRALLVNYALQGVATGSSLAGLVFVATYVLGDTAAAGVVFVCLFVAAIVSVPLWERVGARVGKRAGLAMGTVVYAVGTASLLPIGILPEPLIYLAGVVIGVGYAAMQVFPMSMLPDVTEAAARSTGEPMQAGVFAGLWTCVETGGLAVGSLVFALALTLGGYHSGVDGVEVAQSVSAQTAMTLGFAAVPAVLVLLSLFPLARYRLPTAGT